MLVRRPWSADSLSQQLGLRTTGSCGVVARSRAVGTVVPEGCVSGLRWAWLSSWMLGRRSRKLGSVEGFELVARGRRGRFGTVLLEVRPRLNDACVLRVGGQVR